MTKPPKNTHVEACWRPSFWVRAKWTGRRWMRHNDLFGGYDPVPEPIEWRTYPETRP